MDGYMLLKPVMMDDFYSAIMDILPFEKIPDQPGSEKSPSDKHCPTQLLKDCQSR